MWSQDWVEGHMMDTDLEPPKMLHPKLQFQTQYDSNSQTASQASVNVIFYMESKYSVVLLPSKEVSTYLPGEQP